jgi:hypothetical protein
MGFSNKHQLNQQQGWSKILQAFQACSFLVAIISDPLGRDFGCSRLASLMLVAIPNPPSHGPHVDHHLYFPLSSLQLLMTFLIIVILILVVLVLHLLCL